jgi:hypothetical protein
VLAVLRVQPNPLTEITMNPFRFPLPHFPRFAFAARSLLAGLGLLLGCAAQASYCISIHDDPAASGVNNTGGSSQVASAIDGAPNVTTTPAPGQTAAQVSAAHEAAFRARGYTTVRSSPEEFCVTAGPGGAPLGGGLAHGTDDTGLDIDGKIVRPRPPVAPPVRPDDKDNGVPVPVPPDHQPPIPQPLQIVILIYIVDQNGVVVVIQIQVFVPAGANGAQIRQLIEQALRAHGLLPSRVRYPNLLQPGQLVDGLWIDRTVAGEPVVGFEYRYDARARQVLHRIGGAGFLPTFGAAEYGRSLRGACPIEPRVGVQGAPRLGSFFDVFHDFGLSFAPGGIVVSLQPGLMPLGAGWLHVDPGLSVFEFALTDAFGRMQRRHSLPNDLALVGLPLCQQAGVLGPAGELGLSPAMRCVVDR